MSRIYPQIDLRMLRSFAAVARCQKVALAAKEIHLSQPAVTFHIRHLESILGRPLFLRDRAGMSLTLDGQKLLQRYFDIERSLQFIEADFDKFRMANDHLRFVAGLTIATRLIPPLLAAYAHKLPNLRVELRIENSDGVLTKVKTGEFAFGAIEGIDRAPGLELRKFLDDEIIFVGSPTLLKSGFRRQIKGIHCDELSKLPIIWRERGSNTRRIVEKKLKQLGISLQTIDHRLIFSGVEVIKQSVIAGLGFAFLSKWSISSELQSGSLIAVPIADLAINRGFHWVFPAGCLVEPALSFVNFCDTFFRSSK